MAENIGNQFWQVLTSILAIISIILSFVTYKSRRRKGLSYSKSSTAVLPNAQDRVGKMLKILFDGREVQQIYFNTVTLLCSGNETIRCTDYEKQKPIDVNLDTRILSAEIVKPSPRSLEPELQFDEVLVTLQPFLMNHGDRVDMKILTGAQPHNIEIRAHIAGVEKIKEINRHVMASYWLLITSMLFFTLSVSMGFSILQLPSSIFDWRFIAFLISVPSALLFFAASRIISGPKL